MSYGVKVKSSRRRELVTLSLDVMTDFYLGCSVKPYLSPISSMTEEEKKEYYKTFFYSDRYEHEHQINGQITFETYDWLNKYHFDFRHLIRLGLALKAPEGMY